MALVYARALLGLGEKTGNTDDLLAELDSLLDDVFVKCPGFERVLSSPRVKHEERVGILDRTLGGQASPNFLNFLKVLSKNGRLGFLPLIRDVARGLHDKKTGVVRVEVRTAQPVDGGMIDEITGQVARMFQGRPVVAHVVDPTILGGVMLRVGDTVYDGSVSARLKQLRAEMLDRSVYEIQSRRDRFCHSEGN
jgi:F-type H+-transporting ATPase subunit delta